MDDEKKGFEITELAVREIIFKFLKEIDLIEVHSSKDIQVEKVDNTYSVSINLSLKQLKPIPEVGEYIQKHIFDSFKSSTGMELKEVNLFIENITGD